MTPGARLRVAALCIGLALGLAGAGTFLPLAEWLSLLGSKLRGTGPLGAVLFCAVYVGGVMLFIPAWTFSIAAGLLYGVWGVPLAWLSMMAAASLAFPFTRGALAGAVAAALDRRPRLRLVADVMDQEGWRMVLLIRISGIVPFGLQNYALGVTRIRFGPYCLATGVGVVPGVLLHAGAGAFGQEALAGPGADTLKIAVLCLSILAALALVFIAARRIRARLG